MGDQLENFIMANREEFDNASPSENTWKGIDQKLSDKHSIWPTVWKVAAMIFMVSTIYLMIDKRQSEELDGPTLSDEFTQAEDYYVTLIAQRKQAIQEQLTPEQHEQFLVEIDQLDSMYIELKKTYQYKPFKFSVCGLNNTMVLVVKNKWSAIIPPILRFLQNEMNDQNNLIFELHNFNTRSIGELS